MNVFLTVDVECYSGDYEREVYGGGLGLDYVLGVCANRGIDATFFVEVLAATRWGEKAVRDVCARILEKGQDIQLHLHPVVANLDWMQSRDDLMCGLAIGEQKRLIETGLRLLADSGVNDACTFRAGDLAANVDTLRAMRELGVRLGSNRDLDLKSSINTRLNEAFPVVNDMSELNGVRDLPVSVLRSAVPALDGEYRHMEIAAMGLREMCAGLVRMSRAGYSCATILTHPGEFFMNTAAGPRALEKNCRRLAGLVEFVTGREDMGFTSVAICRTEDLTPLKQPSIPRANPVYALARIVGQTIHRVMR